MADGGDGVDLGIAGLGPGVLVGRGGFGLVYRATQLSSRGVVAVKVLQGHLEEAAVARFEREASALGALRGHPNICTVYDAGVDPEGRPYLVMEYAPSSLATRISEGGALPWEEAAALGVRLAGALETAHRADLLHRDVKPENVLVTSFGEWRLADFGLVRTSDDTLSRSLTATVSHAAPELLAGDPASVASDVYALGSTLFVALTGHNAFATADRAHPASLYRQIAEDPVPDLPGTPEALADVIKTAMAKGPTDRYPSAEAMGQALQTAQQEAGVAATAMALPTGDVTPAAVATAPAAADALTFDDRTPHRPADMTAAVDRAGRGAPPRAQPVDTPPPSPRANRRIAYAALAVAVVAFGLVIIAGALREDGDNERTGTASDVTTATAAEAPTSPDEITFPNSWQFSEYIVDECTGAGDAPCPDLSGFDEIYFSTDCAPQPLDGGFGRSTSQEAEPQCEIALLGLDPRPLELESENLWAAEVATESPPGGLVMEYLPECNDSLTNLAVELSVADEEIRDGRRVATQLTGKLYAYLLTDPGVNACGSSYVFSFKMDAVPTAP
jgi:hypothetical protein